ncbi:hypothetical protein HanIR_Chr02g0069931 [Helianthus annuus]|nr:hypothetical protein HanIR_Chr02g0069931 [Helianthus annuus]
MVTRGYRRIILPTTFFIFYFISMPYVQVLKPNVQVPNTNKQQRGPTIGDRRNFDVEDRTGWRTRGAGWGRRRRRWRTDGPFSPYRAA